MEYEKLIVTRGLPKTGQVTSWSVADDGHVQAGWWRNTRGKINKVRFQERDIGVDIVVLDRATGLMWVKDTVIDYTWLNACSYCYNLNFAGFTDWRLPNIFELYSLSDFSKNPPVRSEFNWQYVTYGYYWSGTVYTPHSGYCMCHDADSGRLTNRNKTYLHMVRPVRTIKKEDYF